MRGNADEDSTKRNRVAWLLFLSVVAIIWWACIWTLFEAGLEALSGHRKNLHLFFYGMIATFIFFVFYEYPDLFEKF